MLNWKLCISSGTMLDKIKFFVVLYCTQIQNLYTEVQNRSDNFSEKSEFIAVLQKKVSTSNFNFRPRETAVIGCFLIQVH